MNGDTERGVPAADDRLALSGLLLVALGVRIVAWMQTTVLFNDGPIFLAMAEAIGRGDFAEVLAHPYHPLYPALAAVVAVFPIRMETAAVVVSIFGGLLTVGALFLFTRAAFGREVAFLAAWVAALHPWSVDFSSDVMSDGLYAGFFVSGMAAMARLVDEPTMRSGVTCGLCAGLAYLVRPEGAGLVVAAILLLGARIVFQGRSRGARTRESVLAGAGLVLVAASIMLPFVIGVGLRTGDFVLTQKKSLTRMVGLDEGRGPVLPRRADAPSEIPLPEQAVRVDGPGAQRPSRDVAGLVETGLRTVTTSMSAFRFELLPFALVGCWALVRSRDPRRPGWIIGLPILLYTGLFGLLVWSAGYLARRHALVPWIPAIALAALGWRVAFVHLVPARWRGSRWVVAALVVVLVLAWGPRDLRPRRADRAAVREAAEWLAREHPRSGPVAAQKLRTAYYAEADFVPLMPGHDGALEQTLRGRGARWVVIDEDKLDDHLGLESGIGDWLEPVHVATAGPQRALVLALDGSKPAR